MHVLTSAEAIAAMVAKNEREEEAARKAERRQRGTERERKCLLKEERTKKINR